VKLTQPRPQDRPFVSAANYLRSTPQSQADSRRPPPGPPLALQEAPHRVSSPPPSPLPRIFAGVSLMILAGTGIQILRRRRFRRRG
jgi:hypothetical protein